MNTTEMDICATEIFAPLLVLYSSIWIEKEESKENIKKSHLLSAPCMHANALTFKYYFV